MSAVARTCLAAGVVTRTLLLERSEGEFLELLELIPSAEGYKKKEVRVVCGNRGRHQAGPDSLSAQVRVNTKLVYNQQKFNLLREARAHCLAGCDARVVGSHTRQPTRPQESEGYAKVLTVLNNGSASAITGDSVHSVARTLQSLIGCFDLDPNRVFDLVLDSLAEQPDNAALLHLVALFDAAKAAQLLGFKFQWHARWGAEDPAGALGPSGPTPFGLYKAAAVLITSGVVTLDAVYAHLAPADAAGAEQTATQRAEAAAAVKRIGVVNLAAKEEPPVVDERNRRQSAPAPLPTQQPVAPVVPDNQKYGLVAGLLDIGAWDAAKGLIQRLQRAGMDPLGEPMAADALRRLMLARTQHLTPLLAPAPVLVATTPGDAPSAMDATPSPEDAAAHAAKHPCMPGDVLDMLSHLTWRLSGDVRLFTRVVRLLRSHLMAASTPAACAAACAEPGPGDDELSASNAAAAVSESATPAVRDQVDTALRTCILPALCLVPSNPAAAIEVWGLLRLFPYTTRFRLYADWRAATSGDAAPSALGGACAEALQETKKVLRRLSKDNVKDFGRKLGKVSQSCPLVVMHTLLAQIEAYSSMIPPVVEALKYLSPLGFDCATGVLLDLLTLPRAKLKEDGQNVSLWLSSLASVAGQLVKRYPGIEVHALLRYLTAQLADSQTVDLLVLKEVLARTTGFDCLQDLSDAQLDAAAGSSALAAEAVSFGSALPPRVRAKGIARLKAALLRCPDPVALPLLLLMAQARNHIVFTMESRQLKLIGLLYDQCCEVLGQYTQFLEAALQPTDAYADLLPALGELVETYSLQPEVAMAVYRPVLRTAQPLAAGADAATAPALACGKVHATWGQLYGQVQSLLPEATWQAMSPALYVQFWSMTLYDLGVPTAAYDDRIERAQASLTSLATQRDATAADAAQRRREQDRLKALVEQLKGDRQRQTEHCAAVDAALRGSKDSWLADLPGRSATVTQFLQTCVLPRCVSSLPDAVFCARFVARLHSLGTPYFSTLQYYDRLLKDLRQLVFAATEHEAAALGRFLHETLSQLAAWKKSEGVYTAECASRPGFGHNFLEPDSKRASYADFVAVSFKWHSKLVRALASCLESPEFMEVRNALIVLTRVSKVYPVTRKHGAHLEKRVAKIKAEDPREDLKTLAGRYLAVLHKERPGWVSDEEFTWTGPGPYVPPKPPPQAAAPAAKAATAATAAAAAAAATALAKAAPTAAKPAAAAGAKDKAATGDAKQGASAQPSAPERRADDRRDGRVGGAAPEKTSAQPPAAAYKRGDDAPSNRDRERERDRDRDRERDQGRDRERGKQEQGGAGGAAAPSRPPPVPGARAGERGGRGDEKPQGEGEQRGERDRPSTAQGRMPPSGDAGRSERRPPAVSPPPPAAAPAARDADAPREHRNDKSAAPARAGGERERERDRDDKKEKEKEKEKERDREGKRHKEKDRKHDKSRSRSRSRSRERRKDKDKEREKEKERDKSKGERGSTKPRDKGEGGDVPPPPPLPPPPSQHRGEGGDRGAPARPRSRSPARQRDQRSERDAAPKRARGEEAPAPPRGEDYDAKRRRVDAPPPPPLPLPPPLPPPPSQQQQQQQQQQRRFPPARPPPPVPQRPLQQQQQQRPPGPPPPGPPRGGRR